MTKVHIHLKCFKISMVNTNDIALRIGEAKQRIIEEVGDLQITTAAHSPECAALVLLQNQAHTILKLEGANYDQKNISIKGSERTTNKVKSKLSNNDFSFLPHFHAIYVAIIEY